MTGHRPFKLSGWLRYGRHNIFQTNLNWDGPVCRHRRIITNIAFGILTAYDKIVYFLTTGTGVTLTLATVSVVNSRMQMVETATR